MEHDVIIETPRLILRVLVDEDFLVFSSINKDPDIMKYFPSTMDDKSTKKMIANEQESYEKNGYCLFGCVVKKTRKLIGFVGLNKVGFDAPFVPAVEVGWRLAKEYWNQGYATEAALAVIDWGFTEIGLQEIVSFTSCQNKASIRVMEKCGLTRNSEDDFLHPKIKKTDALAPHVLYRLKKKVQ